MSSIRSFQALSQLIHSLQLQRQSLLFGLACSVIEEQIFLFAMIVHFKGAAFKYILCWILSIHFSVELSLFVAVVLFRSTSIMILWAIPCVNINSTNNVKGLSNQILLFGIFIFVVAAHKINVKHTTSGVPVKPDQFGILIITDEAKLVEQDRV